MAKITDRALPDGGRRGCAIKRADSLRRLPYKSVVKCTVRQRGTNLFLETKILGATAEVSQVIQDRLSQPALQIACTP
jgi:hypothetical protein